MGTVVEANDSSENLIKHHSVFSVWRTRGQSVRKVTFQIFGAFLLALALWVVADFFIATATLAYSLMVIGVIHGKRRELHWKFMTATMLMDFLLVLTIELNRQAIQTTLSFTLNAWQQTHIYVSTVTLICYIPLSILGWKYLKDKTPTKKVYMHRRLGILTFILRTLSFVLMFSMLK